MEAQLETVMRSLKNPTIANLVAANGGIPGIIPAGPGSHVVVGGGGVDMGDDELRSPSESLHSLPGDHHLQPPSSSRHYGAPPLSSGNPANLYSSTPRPSFGGSPSGSGAPDDRDGSYHSATQQQLTRNTENLTSHSPVIQSPSSPRMNSSNGGMNPPTSNARGQSSTYLNERIY